MQVSKGEQKELLNKSTQRGGQIKKVESISSIAVKLDKSLTARSYSGYASTGASSTVRLPPCVAFVCLPSDSLLSARVSLTTCVHSSAQASGSSYYSYDYEPSF